MEIGRIIRNNSGKQYISATLVTVLGKYKEAQGTYVLRVIIFQSNMISRSLRM